MNKKRIIYIIVVAVLALTTITLSVLLFTKDEKKDNSYYDNKCLSFAFQNTNLSKGQIIFVGD